jgi:protein-tyrosine phosphatase
VLRLETGQNVLHAREEPAAILVVCTGNVCRSPLMERLLVSRLDERLGARQRRRQIEVASAGTRALTGLPMTAEAASELLRCGGDPEGFVARQLMADMVNDADLVITATRAHRAEVVTLSPRATRYTFTALELARLLRDLEPSALSGDAATRALSLAPAAASRRGFIPPVPRGADDLPDPYGRPSADYRRVTDQMVPVVETLLAAIIG